MRRAVEEVKKLLVPAVSNHDADLIRVPTSGAAAQRPAAALPVYFLTYSPREQVAEGTLRYGGKNK